MVIGARTDLLQLRNLTILGPKLAIRFFNEWEAITRTFLGASRILITFKHLDKVKNKYSALGKT